MCRMSSPKPLQRNDGLADRMQMPRNRWVFLVQGTAVLLLGVLFIGERGETIRLGIIFFGIYWLSVSIIALVKIFVDHSGPWILFLLMGLFGVVAALFAFRQPVLASINVPAMLVVILAAQGFIMGALDVIYSLQSTMRRWFILGSINVTLGLLLVGALVAAEPISPLAFGILLLIQSAALVIWAFRVDPRS